MRTRKVSLLRRIFSGIAYQELLNSLDEVEKAAEDIVRSKRNGASNKKPINTKPNNGS